MTTLQRRRERLGGLFLLGFVLFNYPVLYLFADTRLLLGIPVLYLYLFAAWLGLILLLALSMEGGPVVEPEAESKTGGLNHEV